MPAHRAVKGFTLPEMLIALAVISILGLLAMRPMKTYIRRLQFDSAADGIKGLLATAKARAMANPGEHCGVYFDVNAKPQRVLAFLDNANPRDYVYESKLDKPYLQPYVLKKGLAMEIVASHPSSVIFRGDGSAYLSGRVTLSDGILTDTLDVLASTGRIKVLR
jgi:prepilin-type N-terminal cleavage/methylation domain-containing protein